MSHTIDDLVAERVAAVVERLAEQHGISHHMSRDEHLVDAGFTSMTMVDLMLAIEAEFDLTIPQNEMTPLNFRSIDTLAIMLERVKSKE